MCIGSFDKAPTRVYSWNELMRSCAWEALNLENEREKGREGERERQREEERSVVTGLYK